MKKLYFLLASMMLTAGTVSAQQVKLWKNGNCISQIPVTEIDSITFVENTGEVSLDNLKLSDLVGTWQIVHSRVSKKVDGAVSIKDRDVELDFDCFVFSSDKTLCYLENSEDIWHEDGKSNFDIVDGKFTLTSGDMSVAKIVSYTGNEMVLEYEFGGNSDNKKHYLDTLKRISQRTDVVKTDDNPNPARLESIPYLNSSDLVGTWLITYEKYSRTENDEIVDSRVGNVEDEKNYVVLFADGRYGFIEYSDDSNTWHLDGGEYSTYTIDKGNFSLPGSMLLEYNGTDTMKVFSVFVEEKGSTTVVKRNIRTLHRVNTETDYITYRE